MGGPSDDGFSEGLFISAWLVAGFFAMLSVATSMHLVFQHLRFYSTPLLQRPIVRILWMVPIYATTSWLSLYFVEWALYLNTVRDCYEAFVLYQFFALLVNFLGVGDAAGAPLPLPPPHLLPPAAPNGDAEAPPVPPPSGSGSGGIDGGGRGGGGGDDREDESAVIVARHPWPLHRLLPPFTGTRRALLQFARRAVLQFVFVKPLMAVIALLLETQGLFAEGSLRLDRGYFWVTAANNISISISLYFLIIVYEAFKEDLQKFHPLPKFLAVKSVVFFTFWQGCAIVLLEKVHFIRDHPEDGWEAESIANALQNFLICLEMFALALAHHYVFPSTEFQPPASLSDTNLQLVTDHALRERVKASSTSPIAWVKSLGHTLDHRDVLDDTFEALTAHQEPHSKAT